MIPQNSLISLEFNKLLEIIAQYARSDASRNAILSIAPLSSKQEIEDRFACIKEIMRMSQKAMPLDILPFRDIEPLLQKVQPKDAVPETVELVWLMDLLSSAYNAARQIKEDNSLINLNKLIKNLTGMPELLNILRRSIDKDGGILDSASPELSDLRRKKRRIEAKIRKSLEEITRDENTAAFLQDNFITQRSGRWVIPVRMDSKGHVQGVVHDVSRTGETAFVEPISIIGLSNELENIIADEKAEEIRILKVLGLQIRKQADEIKDEFGTLVYLDMLKSIAMFADRFRMQIPEINEQNILKLSKARHPLLLYSSAQKNRMNDIVPIDVNIGEDKSVMVITGPNAGGKSVTIKTIGLLSAMALSGMPVPADSSITIPLFHNLLVDIGDRQSIADNLSTFTAHLSNMMEFLKKADSSTLVLIDELGTGTDPEEGAALACAILKELKAKGSLIFATTHLTDIKVFAHKTEGMVNASMEFDHKTLAPLYRLRIGEPGQSFAIETAKRYGMPESIIESARIMLGKGRAELENLLHDLEQKRRHYEDSAGDMKKHERELTEREEKLGRLLKDAEAKKKELFAKAYKDASEIIADTKRQMNSLLEEIKKAEKDKAKIILRKASTVHEQAIEKIREYKSADTETLSMDELKEGDAVFIKSIGSDAVITKLLKKSSRVKIKTEKWEMEVPLSDVGRKKGKVVKAEKGGILVSASEEAVAAQINLIGLRVDEAIPRLEKFLNHAVLAGFSEVTIIHGTGAGILSKAVREHLSGHRLVEGFRSGEQSEGGAGVTVVTLS